MRRVLTVVACAALVVGSGAPVLANDKAQSDDQPITAQGKGKGERGDKGGRGDRDGKGDRDGRGYRGDRGDRDRGHGGHYRSGRGHRHHHDGHHRYRRHHHYDDDYYYYGHRYRHGRYYDGYYGGRYYYDDPYYDRYYYDRDYYDRYYYDRYYYDRGYCYGGPRSDNRCGDCKQADSPCERKTTRERQCGSGDCYNRESTAKQQ
jgi:hypothetical protein